MKHNLKFFANALFPDFSAGPGLEEKGRTEEEGRTREKKY